MSDYKPDLKIRTRLELKEILDDNNIKYVENEHDYNFYIISRGVCIVFSGDRPIFIEDSGELNRSDLIDKIMLRPIRPEFVFAERVCELLPDNIYEIDFRYGYISVANGFSVVISKP